MTKLSLTTKEYNLAIDLIDLYIKMRAKDNKLQNVVECENTFLSYLLDDIVNILFTLFEVPCNNDGFCRDDITWNFYEFMDNGSNVDAALFIDKLIDEFNDWILENLEGDTNG